MITTNNNVPNFKQIIIHPSYKNLGHQGQKSLEILNPLLEQMGDDCDFVLGAAPNRALGNKPSLTIICQDLNTAKNGILSKITRFFSTVHWTAAQSSTEAVSPHSLYATAANAKMTLATEALKDFTIDADAFFAKPETRAAITAYEKSYTKIPTAADILKDERRAYSTAKASGLHEVYPLLG